ncbi:hypothetical protein APR50_24410 [Variovorax paradoxus]|nr:hypothetical protein APR52_35720 [Variovorax paradoxus]KPV02074.1 hypothetical protein APR49_29845 [Variovorax paradoxus]KPV03583.1 hypothetical protein APR50_24410 [Variovorax paradoxus]KPV23122.1 hypothetical protein APR51_08475 [Variovorax paradoxus]KPV32574.1 hypothetical protein APR47_19365 [Variovorax paradoxus]
MKFDVRGIRANGPDGLLDLLGCGIELAGEFPDFRRIPRINLCLCSQPVLYGITFSLAAPLVGGIGRLTYHSFLISLTRLLRRRRRGGVQSFSERFDGWICTARRRDQRLVAAAV